MSDDYSLKKYGKTKNKGLPEGFTITVTTLNIEVLNWFDKYFDKLLKDLKDKELS